MFGFDPISFAIVYFFIFIYFLIVKPVGKGFKYLDEEGQRIRESRKREEEKKREVEKEQKETLPQKSAYTKEYKEKTEEEFHRLRKRYLQFIKKSYIERGELQKWEQMMKLSDDILSKYDK